jgi:hypothetical protein
LKTIVDEVPRLSAVKHIRMVLFDAADQRLHAQTLEELTEGRQT